MTARGTGTAPDGALVPLGLIDPLHPSARGEIARRLAAATSGLDLRAADVAAVADAEVVLSGPTMAALARSIRARRRTSERGAVVPAAAAPPSLRVSIAVLQGWCDEIAAATSMQRLLFPSVDPDEADTVAAASHVASELARQLGAARLVLTGWGTHEGHVRAALARGGVTTTVGGSATASATTA